MDSNMGSNGVELLCVIVNFGVGSKIAKCAKKHGIKGSTIFLGKGTIKNPFLEFLELNEVRKEIVLMAGDKKTVDSALEELTKKFNFAKPNRGIAFSTSLTGILGCKNIVCQDIEKDGGMNNPMYNLIFVVADKGKAEVAVEAANKAGSRGATIINARGSGIHESSKLFAMEIEPEKEIVLIISEENLTEAIVSAVRDGLQIDKPGNGIIFIQNVNKAYGLY